MHSEDRRYLGANLVLAAVVICCFGMLAFPVVAFVLNVFVDFGYRPVERIAPSGPEAQKQLRKAGA